MQFSKLIPGLFITLLITACERSGTLSAEEKKEIESEVSSTLKNYYDAIRISGLNAEFKYLDSSGEFFWKPPGFSSAIDFDSVAHILRRNAANYKLVDNTFDTLKLTALSREECSYSAKLLSTITDTSGNTSTYTMAETGTLVKRKDGWKLLNGETHMITNGK